MIPSNNPANLAQPDPIFPATLSIFSVVLIIFFMRNKIMQKIVAKNMFIAVIIIRHITKIVARVWLIYFFAPFFSFRRGDKFKQPEILYKIQKQKSS